MSRLWKNWSGDQQCRPASYEQPDSAQAVSELVRQCRQQGQVLRVNGSAHSFTALVPTDSVMVSLDRMQGLDSVAPDRKTATVLAGTKLRRLGELLHEQGLAQENLGDIDAQAIAGALSTGTHGTGTGFGTLSTQIEGMEIVDGTGQIHWLDRETDPQAFSMARIALGTLGVITRLRLRTEPAYRLEFITSKGPLDQALRDLPRHLREHRNYEFYWFPFSGMVQHKFSNVTDKPARSNSTAEYLSDIVLENYVFKLFCETARLFPATCAPISRLSARAVSTSSKVNWSHQVYATARLVRFHEMEYNIPREAFSDVMRLLEERVERERFRVNFPVECRFVAADDIALSPAYGRESAYLAVHMYRGMPYREYFDAAEEIFLAHEGRPHWGKLHSLQAAQLEPRYPLWRDFMALRARMDPDGIFLNPYLERLLGVRRAGAEASGVEAQQAAQRPGLRVQVG
jgi:FAD-linked oxidoreductase